MVAFLGMAASAHAQDERPDFQSERLTGNWGGMRDRLYDQGYNFDFYYKVDAWRNLSGGVQTGNRALDNLDMKMTVDGARAFGSDGTTLQVYLLNNNGGRVNDLAGTSGGIDNIEVGTRSFKLYEAWIEQKFASGKISLLAGLHDLNSEFYVTDTSGLFLNPTYGIGTEMAATGDNGPSIFSNTSAAVRLAVHPTGAMYAQAAIFDGVPGSSKHPRGTHVDFNDKDGALLVGEGGIADDSIGHFAIGSWKYTARRPDQLTPGLREHSQGIYFMADKSVYKNGDRDISAFARLGYTAGDVESFKSSWALGAVASGFIPGREDGQLGLAVSQAINSNKFKAANAPVQNSETQLELTYSDKITPWLNLQPDLQYTVNPGTDPALDNAWTVGFRLSVDF